MTTQEILQAAQGAKMPLALADADTKNAALEAMAVALIAASDKILEANQRDLDAARGRVSDVMLDRLALTPSRLTDMAKDMREVAALPDPVGAVLRKIVRPNGLIIEKTAVPMGVIAIIYESRPNVTSDAAALAIKAGSACILRCGRDAWASCHAIVEALRAGRTIDKIFIAKGDVDKTLGHIASKARSAGIVVTEADRRKLDAMSQTHAHQGVIALCAVKEYSTIEDMLAIAAERGEAPFLVLCDEISDPHNLGAIIRTAECVGAHGVIIPKRRKARLPECAVSLLSDTSHASANELMTADGLVDLLIPRGGAGLIRACVENATVPCIQTGTGICHVYVDKAADLEMAVDIVENAKTSRPSVCNAEEVLLVDKAIAPTFLPMLYKRLVTDRERAVELRLDETAAAIIPGKKAGEKDFDTEFLDYILAVKCVGDVKEAVAHIAAHSTGHSEAIVTRSPEAERYFTANVDSAAVYVNASTRFTDGGEFGLGCEMGISTQKLHARGPMGLQELTTYKYIIHGNGHIR